MFFVKAVVFGLDGAKRGEVELPTQFNEEYRPDLIRRAFHAEATARLQPKGTFLLAGLQTSARYYGRRHAWRQIINTGRSRLPREKISGGGTGRVRIVPHARGGRRAHPPKVEKRLRERINFKENNKAIRSALAACANAALVKARGHAVGNGFTAPIVVEDAFESLSRVKDAKKTLKALGLENDLERAARARKRRSGRARLRKGGYRVPKSVLIVFGEDKGVWRAVRNLPGVDAVRVDKLNAELLAPGGDAGRLAVFTRNALAKLSENGLYL
ncbi:MAG: 50S ribosomal protein L4 [Candidatus Norongarragalinales archaeon]